MPSIIKRLWGTIKYEEVYLPAYTSVPEARAGIGGYLNYYNSVCTPARTHGACMPTPHSSLDGKTPDQACFNQTMPEAVAA